MYNNDTENWLASNRLISIIIRVYSFVYYFNENQRISKLSNLHIFIVFKIVFDDDNNLLFVHFEN